MVTRSVDNYQKHKSDVYDIVKNKYGQDKADVFIKHFSNQYDSHNRSFLDYRLAFSLIDDYKYCEQIGTKWYAFVGVGGTGKTTLAKNVFYFLDNTFDLSRTTTEMKELIEILSKFTEQDTLKALYLDEPDDEIVAQSKQGKILRKIFGKIRQQKAFIGIAATDLTDIPPYIYRKIDGVFFTPYLGKFMFFKNNPKKKSYVLQRLRKEYADKGYSIFYQLQKSDKNGCLMGDTQKATPLDYQDGKYLKQKRKDYEKNIKQFIEGDDALTPEQQARKNRDQQIWALHLKGLSYPQIAKKIGGLTTQSVSRVVNALKFA